MPEDRDANALTRPGMAGHGYQLARMDLTTIRLAVDCALTGSLTAAARAANMVPPAASRRIRDLERMVAEPLFERTPRGMTCTTAGKAFVRHGLTMLRQMESLSEELGGLRHGMVRRVRLCASTAAINQFLPPLLAAHETLRPDIFVALEEQVSEQAVASLREGRADLAVFVHGPDCHDLDVRKFRTDELVLVLPAGHSLAGKSPLNFDQALDEPWISLNTGAALLEQQHAAARTCGRPLRLRMQVRSFDAVGHLVAAGMGIALLPKTVACQLSRTLELSWRPLADRWAHRQLSIAMRAEAGPHVTELRDYLSDVS